MVANTGYHRNTAERGSECRMVTRSRRGDGAARLVQAVNRLPGVRSVMIMPAGD